MRSFVMGTLLVIAACGSGRKPAEATSPAPPTPPTLTVRGFHSERSLEDRRTRCEAQGFALAAGNLRSVALGKEASAVQLVAKVPLEHRLTDGITRLGDDLVLGGYQGLVIVRAGGAIEALSAPEDRLTQALQRIDLDGDGDLDVLAQVEHPVVTNNDSVSEQRKVVWLAQAGTLQRAQVFDPVDEVSGPLVADLDGDKRPDALQLTELGIPRNAGHAFSELLDFDGDGALDAAFASVRTDGTDQVLVGVLRSVGKRPRGKTRVTAVSEYGHVQGFGDLSGDGVADLAFSDTQRGSDKYQIRVAYGRRDGTFAPAKLVFVGFQAHPLVRYVDLDGDARSELFTLEGSHVRAWKLSDGAATLALDRELDGLGEPLIGSNWSVHVEPANGASPAVMHAVAAGCDGY